MCAGRPRRSHVPCSSGPVSDSLPVAGPACARLPVRTSAVGDVSPVGAGPQALCGRAGGGAGRDPGPSISVAEPLLQIRIVVARALSMSRIVPPVLDMRAAIDVDASTGPVDAAAAPVTAAAPVSAGRPSSQRVACAEHETGRDHAGGDVARIAPVIGVCRIVGVWPVAVDHLRFVIGNVEGIRHGGFDRDDLPALLLPHAHDLLLGRHQLLPVVSPRAHPLHGRHDVLFLRKERLAELLGPVETFAHHLQNRGRCNQRFDARIPVLLLGRCPLCLFLEVLVVVHPALGPHHFERIGRCHQNVRQQRIRVQRDRRHQRIELGRLQRRLLRSRRGRAAWRLSRRAAWRLGVRVAGLASCRNADMQHFKKSTRPADRSEKPHVVRPPGSKARTQSNRCEHRCRLNR